MKNLCLLFFCVVVLIMPANAQEDSLFAEINNPVSYDFIPGEDNYELVLDRLSCLENQVPLTYNTTVHSFVNYFTVRNRSFIKTILERKDLFFPVFEQKLAEHGLPDELKYLSIIESGLNPRAVSSARAAGLWQFMSYTGKSFGLHQDAYIDERMDFERATDAACRYLKQLYGMFGDWELAIAAYNTGPGNVRKAMKRSGKDKFWEMYPYLHRETRAYLPQYVAVAYVMNHLEEYNFIPEKRNYLVQYDTIMVDKYLHIPTLAAQLDLCEEEIMSLNTGLRYNAFPDSRTPYPLRLPIQSFSKLEKNRESILDSASRVGKDNIIAQAGNNSGTTYGKSKIVYRVQSGDVLGKIASTYNVKVSDLKAWNNLSSDMIRVGQRLDIWLKPSDYKPATSVASTAKPASPQKEPIISSEDGTKTYIVQPGDTLWDISKKFNGISIDKIKELNSLESDDIKPGQKLKIG